MPPAQASGPPSLPAIAWICAMFMFMAMPKPSEEPSSCLQLPGLHKPYQMLATSPGARLHAAQQLCLASLHLIALDTQKLAGQSRLIDACTCPVPGRCCLPGCRSCPGHAHARGGRSQCQSCWTCHPCAAHAGAAPGALKGILHASRQSPSARTFHDDVLMLVESQASAASAGDALHVLPVLRQHLWHSTVACKHLCAYVRNKSHSPSHRHSMVSTRQCQSA